MPEHALVERRVHRYEMTIGASVARREALSMAGGGRIKAALSAFLKHCWLFYAENVSCMSAAAKCHR